MAVTSAGQTRLLFIARAYPPTIGGMENFAYRLSESMRQRAHVTMLVNRRGKKALPAFLPYALGCAVYLARRDRVQAVHLADALLSPLGALVKTVTRLPVTSTAHGLDITYPNRIYQLTVPRALRRLDMIVADSRATENEVRVRAGEKVTTTVIPLGVDPLPDPGPAATSHFRQCVRSNADDVLLLTVGRLIRRKGVAWFVRDVLPRLPENVIYVVIGDGPERKAIEAAASVASVAGRVRLLGSVPDDTLAAAYHCADLFVMPNVPVPGDLEGFGLVAQEAAAAGLPVVASRLEGITEAVQHRRNGLLVTPLDGDAYATTLTELLGLPREELRTMGASFGRFTREHYSWSETARRYLEVIGDIAAAREGHGTS